MVDPHRFSIAALACVALSACGPSPESPDAWPKLYRPGTEGLYGQPPTKPWPEFIWGEPWNRATDRQRFYMQWHGVTYSISGDLFQAYVMRDGYAPKDAGDE